MVLEKTLDSPLGCKEIKPVNHKGNQSWKFIGRTMLKLKLQYFGHLMQRTYSLETTLMLGKIEGGRRQEDERRWDGLVASLTLWTWVWAVSGSWWWTGKPGILQSKGSQRVGHNWVTELNWTYNKKIFFIFPSNSTMLVSPTINSAYWLEWKERRDFSLIFFSFFFFFAF